jgi:TP901 family phage tail tape measure protein
MASGDFLAKIKLALEGKDAVVSGLQQTQQAAQKLSGIKVTTTYDKEGLVTGKQLEETFKNIKPATDKASTGMKDFGNAMRRALIVAPVWMALRGAMQFFIQGIKEGTEYLLAFDKQMILVSQAINALGANSSDINLLKDSFMSLSRETGNSAAKIAKVYLEIVKASGSYVEASETVKTAVLAQEVAQSETVDIARALALAIKLQGDSFSKTATQQEKYKEVASTLYVLSSKNLVTFEDLAKEYNNFVPAGQAANLTFQETAAILATLNSAGVSNVQGLKTALLRTLADSEKIGKELGIAISPDTKPIELFMTVLSKFKMAMKGGIDLKAFGALGELFGKGGRGGSIIIKTLSDSMEQLNKNLAITKFPVENSDAFNKSLKELQSSLPRQIEEIQNLKQQIFESFIIGVTGGKDFSAGLKNINEVLTESILKAEALGVVFNLLGKYILDLNPANLANDKLKEQISLYTEQADLQDRIQKAIRGEYNLQTSVKILMEAKSSKLITDEKLRNLAVDALENEVKLIHDTIRAEENKTKASSDTLLVLQKQQKELDKQKTKLEALVFQYEKAGALEKRDIRRQMELQTKTPVEVVRAYEESPYDKNLILKNLSNFTDEIREALAKSIGRERGLDVYTNAVNPSLAQQMQSPILNQNVSLGNIIISINPDSLTNLAELSGDMLTIALLKNPDVQQLIANIALNVNPKR